MKRTLPIIIIILLIASFGAASWLTKKEAPAPMVTNFTECVAAGNPVMESYPRQCRHDGENFIENITPFPKPCTLEAKLCPDGSAVGRTGPNCEFTPCPVAGNKCSKDSDCAPGDLCHKNICTSPIGKQCADSSDPSCPSGFECVQSCGPPVVQYPDDTPPTYFCQLKGYVRNCPICLAKNTLIDTPLGAVPIQNLEKGAPVWTTNILGERVSGVVIRLDKTLAPTNHKMVELILDDGREIQVSPGHPTILGRTVGTIAPGDIYDGARVITSRRLPYANKYTYDILVSGGTGFYFANGILLDSTLH